MGQSRATPIGRASFPYLNKLNQYGKYAITILLPKSDPQVVEFVKWLSSTVKSEMLQICGDAGFAAGMKEFKAFHDGDKQTDFKTWRNEYAGHWVLSLSRKADFGKPCVVGRARQPIDAGEVYAGCNILAYVDVFGYKFGAKKSVSVGFQHVMKTGENTRFASSGVEVDQAFKDLDIPEEADPLSGQDPFSAGVPAPSTAPKVVATAPKPVVQTAVSNDPFAGV